MAEITGVRSLLLGLVATIFCIGVSNPTSAVPVSVVNPGFESNEAVSGFPNTFGDWGVDQGTIVGAENGISPRSGTGMLRFDRTYIDSTQNGASSDIFQLIDVTGFATEIATGQAVFSLTAFFNRVAGDTNTDTRFGIDIRSFNATPVDYANSSGSLAFSAQQPTTFISDGLASTWESISTSLVLPSDTTMVLIALIAFENVLDNPNQAIPIEFSGHYADDISASISAVPLPAAFPLFAGGLGLLGLLGWRRKRMGPA